VIFLWKIIEINSYFIPTLLQAESVNLLELYAPLLYIVDDCTGEAMNYSLLNIITFIVLQLSGERDFCLMLNNHYKEWLPKSISKFSGTYADLTIQLFSTIILRDTGSLDQLYACFLIILSNISAFVRNINRASADNILSMLDRFSKPSWIFSKPNRYEVLVYLLEICNSLL
jgi:hypothetical protein